MAVRPFVTSSIALASAGLLIAAAPAVVTPLTQQDIRVVADTEVSLAASPLQQLIDAYLTGIIPETPANTETSANGLLGVLQVLTGGGDFADLPIANAYIGGGPGGTNGLLGVADLLTAGFVGDGVVIPPLPLTNAWLNGGILNVLGTVTAGSDQLPVQLLNAYIAGGPGGTNGALGVADFLTAGFELPSGDEVPALPLTNAWLNGGILNVLGTVTAGSDQLPVQLVNAYIAGYPQPNTPDGATGPNGLIGVTQLIVDTVLAEPVEETLAPATLRAAQSAPEVEEEEGGAAAVAAEGGSAPVTKLIAPKLGSEPSAPVVSPLAAIAAAVEPSEPAPADLPDPADVPTPVKKLAEKSGEADGDKGLVRESKKFSPEVILPFGATGGGGSDDWAGKRFVNQLKEAFSGSKGSDDSSSDGGGSEK